MKKQLLLFITFLVLWETISAKNLLEAIRSIPNFSKARQIIEASSILPILLETKGFTAFIPHDEAMEKYDGPKNEDLIFYHLANIPYRIQDVPDEITTELPGNPRLYVTKIPSGNIAMTGWEDYEYYINNAKVISANHRSQTQNNNVQYLHTVDQVIAPTVAQVSGPDAYTYRHPDAKKVLEKSNVYGLGDHYGLKELHNRVSEMNMLETFSIRGKNTFFMPVNQALKLILKTDKVLIDKQVIQGHIVPDVVLFTRTVRDSKKQFKSMAFTNQLQVFISIENVTNSETGEMTYYVKSNTVSGDPSHMKGAALARIVRGNIPVKNGVIHLIDRPLMVVASSIMSYLQEEKGQLSEFHHLMRDQFPDMMNLLITEQDLTLFAPSNTAFDMVNQERLQKVIANKEKLMKIMRLHILNRRLTTDEIVDHSTNEIFQEETMSPGRKLYFAVNDPNAVVPIVSLEGGGVNATIKTPNIAAKNGVIHIIDRILGIPSQTVYEKLASDPMLSSTFALSEQNGWNKLLNDRDKKFTLFVPSNDAWEYVSREMSSAYKKLFMGDFPYHVKSILQRHMIVNEDLSLEELEYLTTNSTPIKNNMRQTQLQMTRGKIYFQARITQSFGDKLSLKYDNLTLPSQQDEEDNLKPEPTLINNRIFYNTKDSDKGNKEYFLNWNGITAKVIRPDVECVNGVVHVIDKVIMVRSDVTVSGSKSFFSSGSAATLVSAVISLTLAWVFV